MKPKSLLRLSLAALIGLGSALAAGAASAQSDAPMPLNVYLGSSRLPTSIQLMEKALDPSAIAALRETSTVVQAEVWALNDGKDCFAHTGLGSRPPSNDKAPRASLVFTHAQTARRSNEELVATCERAFVESLKKLASSGAFEKDVLLKQAETTSEPQKVEFPKLEPKEGFIAYWTAGTLNEKGEDAIVKELGARWYKVLDYRKYAAYVALMMGETLEGKAYCLVRYGITARAPMGRAARLPAQIRIAYVTTDKNDNCSGKVTYNAAGILRDSYPELLSDFEMSAERGVTYMTVAEVKKKVAKFDADAEKLAAAEAKKAAAEAKKAEARQVASNSRSTNRVTCHNECYNGSCVRTFPDGRKERWQAPRKFDPFTQNWGWDTTTNACGI